MYQLRSLKKRVHAWSPVFILVGCICLVAMSYVTPASLRTGDSKSVEFPTETKGRLDAPTVRARSAAVPRQLPSPNPRSDDGPRRKWAHALVPAPSAGLTNHIFGVSPLANLTGSLSPSNPVVGVTNVSIVGTATANATVTETDIAPSGVSNGPFSTGVNSSGNYSMGPFLLAELGTYRGTLRDSSTGATLSITYSGTGDFSASVNTTSRTVTAGQSTTYTVTFSSIGGFTGKVNPAALNWSNVPGASAFWSTSQVTVPSNGSVQATFTIQTASSTPAGTYGNIILNGKNGSFTRAASTVSLTVNAATVNLTGSLSPSNPIVGVTQVGIVGNATPNATVTETDVGPDGVTNGPFSTQANSSGTYNMGPFLLTQLGTYTGTLRDNSSGQTKTITYSGTGDFSTSVNVTSRTVMAGQSTTYTVTFTSIGGFTGKINPAALNWSNVPGASAFWSASQVTLPSNGSVQATFTIQTATSTPAGTYNNIILLGKNGSFSRGAPTVSLTVNAATVNLTGSMSPSNPIVGVTQVSIVGTATPNATVTETDIGPDGVTNGPFSTVANSSGNYSMGPFLLTQLGTYTGTLRDTVSGQTKTITYSGTGDFSSSVNVTSRTVTAGQSTTYTVTFTSIGGFTGVVTPTALNWSNVPGATASWSANQVTLPSNGSVQATFTIQTAPSTPVGTYNNIILLGKNGSFSRGAATVSLIVNAAPVSLTGTLTPANPIVGVTQVSIVGTATPNATVTETDVGPDGVTNGPFSTQANPSGNYSMGPFLLTQLGTYTGTLRDTSTGQTKTITYSGTGDFSSSVNVTSRTVAAGQTATYTVTFTSIGGFTGKINPAALNWSNVPGATAFWSSSQVTVPSNGSVQATFTIQTATSAPAGTYGSIILNGRNGSFTRNAPTVNLIVATAANLPDLTTSAAVVGGSSYTSGQSGAQAQVTVTRSGGSLPVISGFPYIDARLYFSANAAWDNTDTLLWTSNGATPDYPVGTLNSGGNKTVTATYTIPSVPAAGTYYLISVVDGLPSPNGYYSEGNENNNSSTLPVTVTVAVAQPKLLVTGLEVTQGLQNKVSGSISDLGIPIPLIQDKRTFVRVHAESSSGVIGPVQAQLIGRRIAPNGVSTLLGSLPPSNPGQSIVIFQNGISQRINLNDSFYFELPGGPENWREGTVEFEFRGVSHSFYCSNNGETCKKVVVTFQPPRYVDIRLVGIKWWENGTLREPSQGDFERAAHQIEALFPITRLNRDYPYNIAPTFLNGNRPTSYEDFKKLLGELENNQKNDKCLPPPQGNCNKYYLGIILPPTGIDEPPGILGLASMPGTVGAAYLTPAFTVPHELAHNFGRRHTARCGDPDGTDSNYKPIDGSISSDKTERGVFGFDIFNLSNSGIIHPNTSDVMSYCRPRWISPFTYVGIETAVVNNNKAANEFEAKLAKGQIPMAVSEGEPAVIVSGFVSLAFSTGEFTSVQILNSPAQASAPVPGPYAIRLENSQGQTLSSFGFEPTELSEGSSASFNLLLPWSPGTTRILLLRNGQIIASRNASNNHPLVTVLYPNGGESLNGSVASLTWSASDPDGDSLRYVIQYSADGGGTWLTLSSDWPSTTYDLALSTIPGTNNGLIRVLANDGFHTAQDQSNTEFSVNRHLPQATIQTPQYNALFVGEQTVMLQGSAVDPDDGILGDGALSWSSNLDGPLGVGRSLNVNASALREGIHSINLTAQDSDGQTGSVSVTIQISRTRPALPASLSVSPAATNFSIGTGNVQTAADTIAVRNNGDGNLNWLASADQAWIKLSAQAGPAPTNISVSSDPSGLAPGDYTGQVTVTTNDAANSPQTVTVTLKVVSAKTLQFAASNVSVAETAGSAAILVTRTGDISATATVDYSTWDGTAKQRVDYTTSSGTLNFAAGQSSRTLRVLISDNAYLDGDRSLVVALTNASNGAIVGVPGSAAITILDNDTASPTTNPLDNSDALFFVQQHYFDFLSRVPDSEGLVYWANEITKCGSDATCIKNRRIDVSNAFFYEQEFQQTGAFVYRLYRAAYGNDQPFPNSDTGNLVEAKKMPKYSVFVRDRARVIGGANLAQSQLALANAFVQRPEFLAKYPAALSGAEFVDAVLLRIKNDIRDRSGLPVDLTAQRSSLITLFDQGGRGAVLYRLADDNLQTNPINNRPLVDAEYDRSFVYTQYAGYLRRDSDMGGFLFWLNQVASGPLRDVGKQHAMVCSFITSAEYQQRFSPIVTHFNSECPP